MIQPGGRMKIPVAWKPATQGPGIIPIYSTQRYHGTQAARETIYNVQWGTSRQDGESPEITEKRYGRREEFPMYSRCHSDRKVETVQYLEDGLKTGKHNTERILENVFQEKQVRKFGLMCISSV
jgi:hypothetical protein